MPWGSCLLDMESRGVAFALPAPPRVRGEVDLTLAYLLRQVGTTYTHPLAGRSSMVVEGGDYITTESGTGLVHTAPVWATRARRTTRQRLDHDNERIRG